MKANQRKIGVILSYVSQVVQILSGLIYTPIMLRLLGQNEYGLYQLVASIISSLGLLNFGFTSSYIRFYAKFNANDDKKNIAKLNGMFMLIFTVISIICVICGAIFIHNIDGFLGTKFTYSEISTAKILMSVMIVNMTITFLISTFYCYMTAKEQFFIQRITGLLRNLLNPFLTLPLLMMGFGSISMVVITVILTFFDAIICFIWCIKKLKMEFYFRNLEFSLLKEMWIFTFYIFLNNIIDQVNWNVDKFLLGRYSGAIAVAIYGLAGQINSMYISFSTAISSVFSPKINKILARDESDKEITRLFIKVGRIQYLLIALIISGFVLFGKKFVYLWGGKEYISAYYVCLFLMIPVTIPLIQNLGIEVQRAKNKHKVRSIVYFFISIGNIIISIPLIHKLGSVGAAMGTAISLIMGNILFMNWYYHVIIKIDIISFWKNILQMSIGVLLCIPVGILITKFISINTWVDLMFCILIYSAAYTFSMYLFGMNEYEKSLLTGPIIKLRNKVIYKGEVV